MLYQYQVTNQDFVVQKKKSSPPHKHTDFSYIEAFMHVTVGDLLTQPWGRGYTHTRTHKHYMRTQVLSAEHTVEGFSLHPVGVTLLSWHLCQGKGSNLPSSKSLTSSFSCLALSSSCWWAPSKFNMQRSMEMYRKVKSSKKQELIPHQSDQRYPIKSQWHEEDPYLLHVL